MIFVLDPYDLALFAGQCAFAGLVLGAWGTTALWRRK